MAEEPVGLNGRIPYRAQMPTAQQVAASLAVLTLVGPMGLGGVPVIPVTTWDDQRRRQDQITQQSESNVGTYQTSAQAEVGLALSQQRLASVAREVNVTQAQDVEAPDVIHAADCVFSDGVEPVLTRRFKSAFGHVVNDTVDLYILRDNEEHAH
ncbi:MAG: hypothetical protein Q4A01_01765 [Coriobacteriales bacterium]|nr:hypothetical protein [Coriobacteriales bacterium]